MAYAPGEQIGSIDGWLGFLGGYSGGLLAFFSAIYIFNNQRSENIRPFFNSNSLDASQDSVLYDLSKPDENLINKTTLCTIGLERKDLFIGVLLKNVGLGPALDVAIYSQSGKKLLHYYAKRDTFLDYPVLGTAEISQSIQFSICVNENNTQRKGQFFTYFTVKYKDLHGKNYKQKVVIHKSGNNFYVPVLA